MRLSKLCASILSSVLLLTLCSCSAEYEPIEPEADEIAVVGSVAGKDVYMDELVFVTETNKKLLENRYGEGIFSGQDAEKYREELRELVFSNITASYATILLCEESYIKLGETAVISKVNSTLSDTVKELGGMKKYKAYLEENHLTDRFLRFSIEVSLLEKELLYVYVDDIGLIASDDEEIFDIIQDDFIAVRHVFVPHTDSDALSKIEQAKQALDGGASFETVMEDYNQDSNMSTEGLFILEGYMTQKYDEIAFSLDVSERSGVITDENGYYIVERIELDPMKALLKLDELKELYQTYTLYAIIDEKQKELEFIPNQAALDYVNGVQ